MTTQIAHEADGDQGPGRYTVAVDGMAAGELTYRTVDGRRVFEHTEIDDAFGGQGLGGELVRRALDDAATDDLRIVPVCPYVAHYLEGHPDDQFLIDRDLWAALES